MKSSIRYVFVLGLVALGLLITAPSPARAGVFINVGIAPPALPFCVQPPCPGLGYIWTPGYWAWNPDISDYYWVPGGWVLAPEVGYLWTPAWWSCDNGAYFFHDGYWGPHVGFYGGVAYGYGYNGRGYDGGYWRGHHFYYNRSVNNVTNIERSRTFDRAVAENNSRVSYNGGAGGTTARATAEELSAARGHHLAATSAQRAQIRAASADPSFRHSTNHGQPAVTGTARAGELRNSTASAATGVNHQAVTESHANRAATGESAFTGAGSESHANRVTHSNESAFTGAGTENHANRGTGSSWANAFTGASTESHRAAVTHNGEAKRSVFAESHTAPERQHTEAFHAPAVHMQTFHPAAHAQPSFHAAAAHASVAHASAAHAGGGGGGGHSGGGAHH